MTYLLFSGSEYYPAGGADDFAGAFPSIEAAKAYFAEHEREWAHIAAFDGRQLEIVCAYGTAWDPDRPGITAWHDCRDA
jgi:hypothetical protein